MNEEDIMLFSKSNYFFKYATQPTFISGLYPNSFTHCRSAKANTTAIWLASLWLKSTATTAIPQIGNSTSNITYTIQEI